MSIYTISDPDTRFCRRAMRQCGGRWNAMRGVWMFACAADAADAALELFRATRATPAMREELESMVADSTALAAWEYDGTEPLELETLSFTEARTMLRAGRAVRHLFGVHPLEDMTSLGSAEGASADARVEAFEARARRGMKAAHSAL